MALGFDPKTSAYGQSLVNLPTMDTAEPGAVAPKPAVPVGTPFPRLRSVQEINSDVPPGAAPPAPTPDTASAGAARKAAVDAATSQIGDDAGSQWRPGMFNAPAPKVDPNKDWNDFVAGRLGQMGVPNAAAVMGQTPPSMAKLGPNDPGYADTNEARIARGGDPGLLNYGPNNVIVGSGKGSNGQFNSFTGVGKGAGAAGGAGGAGPAGAGPAGGGVSGGAGNSGSPYSQLMGHITDVMNEHDRLNNVGDISSGLKAAGLRHYLRDLAPLSQIAAQHEFSMGSLGVSQGELALNQKKSAAGIQNANIAAALIKQGDYNGARRVMASAAGQTINPQAAVGPGTNLVNENTPQLGVTPLPYQLGGAIDTRSTEEKYGKNPAAR